MKNGMILFVVLVVILCSCQNKKTDSRQKNGDNNIDNKLNNEENMAIININKIIEHIKLQENFVPDGLDDEYLDNPYNINKTDFLLTIPVIKQGLKDSEFKFISSADFAIKMDEIFGKNTRNSCLFSIDNDIVIYCAYAHFLDFETIDLDEIGLDSIKEVVKKLQITRRNKITMRNRNL